MTTGLPVSRWLVVQWSLCFSTTTWQHTCTPRFAWCCVASCRSTSPRLPRFQPELRSRLASLLVALFPAGLETPREKSWGGRQPSCCSPPTKGNVGGCCSRSRRTTAVPRGRELAVSGITSTDNRGFWAERTTMWRRRQNSEVLEPLRLRTTPSWVSPTLPPRSYRMYVRSYRMYVRTLVFAQELLARYRLPHHTTPRHTTLESWRHGYTFIHFPWWVAVAVAAGCIAF